jgi:hypothetical protein
MTTFNFPKGEIPNAKTIEAPVTREATLAVSRNMPFKSPEWEKHQDGHPYLLFLQSRPAVESGQKPQIVPYEPSAAAEGQTAWAPYFVLDTILKPEYKWFAQSLFATEPEAIPKKYYAKLGFVEAEKVEVLADDKVADIFDALASVDSTAEDVTAAPQKQRGRPRSGE